MNQPTDTLAKPCVALVVDDEQDVKLLFRQRFRKEIRAGKVDLHFAFSGQEALDFLADGTADCVLVLSDINMPGMTGIQLLERVKGSYPQLPVHIITAYGNDDNYRKAMELGADGYLNKPIDFDELKREVFRLA